MMFFRTGRSSRDGRSALQHGGDPGRRSEQETGEKRGSDHVEAKQVADFVQGNRLRSHRGREHDHQGRRERKRCEKPAEGAGERGCGRVHLSCCSIQWKRSQ